MAAVCVCVRVYVMMCAVSSRWSSWPYFCSFFLFIFFPQDCFVSFCVYMCLCVCVCFNARGAESGQSGSNKKRYKTILATTSNW